MLVVSGVIVPAASVGLEDCLVALKGEVEQVPPAVPLERKFANELGDPVRNEEPSRLDLQRRARRVLRVKLSEQLANRAYTGSSRSTKSFEVRLERGH